jgi:segregation and condensation protein A
MNSGVENSTRRPAERPLSHFSVELEVYSGPYEGLLALILRDEVEIFEVPLREIVALYSDARPPNEDPNTLERDTDFVDSATSLVLLKGRALAPAFDLDADETADDPLSPEELEERLVTYLKVRRAAEALRRRLTENAGSYPSAHAPPPRLGRLSIRRDRLVTAARRAFSRAAEPETRHLGPITVTVEDLVAAIRSSLARGPVSFEDLVRGMDRLRSAVAFAAALSLAAEGDVALHQTEPFGPLTLDPTR